MRRRYPTNTIRFDSKPAEAVLQVLRDYGFRWNGRSRCWSAPQSVASATVIDCIRAGDLENVGVAVAERQMEADCGII